MPPGNIIIGILASTIIILLLIVSMVIVVLLARRQSIKQELKEAVYKNKLNDIALASLRAQMNPHFIFNCLNSIKLYTEQNNSAAASEYLSKFSKLIRNMLHNARAEKNILSSEIETLQLYIEMEAMRFKDRMRFEIKVAENVDADFIEIPPLLIQPYVENAIWHGIMHKEGSGKVTVNITQRNTESPLIITVEDDGVGRAKASTLKNNEDHKSYGTQITNDRIALFNERDRLNASVNITDLYSEDGQAAGTLVTLQLLTS